LEWRGRVQFLGGVRSLYERTLVATVSVWTIAVWTIAVWTIAVWTILAVLTSRAANESTNTLINMVSNLISYSADTVNRAAKDITNCATNFLAGIPNR